MLSQESAVTQVHCKLALESMTPMFQKHLVDNSTGSEAWELAPQSMEVLSGWRIIFWIQAGLYALTSIGLILFYHPPKQHSELANMSWKQIIWNIDPIGSLLFMTGTTLIMLALDWAGGVHPWSNAHVAAPPAIGLALLVCFGIYGIETQIEPIDGQNANVECRMERQK